MTIAEIKPPTTTRPELPPDVEVVRAPGTGRWFASYQGWGRGFADEDAAYAWAAQHATKELRRLVR